jgi:hypothetical protein
MMANIAELQCGDGFYGQVGLKLAILVEHKISTILTIMTTLVLGLAAHRTTKAVSPPNGSNLSPYRINLAIIAVAQGANFLLAPEQTVSLEESRAIWVYFRF